MNYNLFKVKIGDKNTENDKYNEIFEFLKLSFGNNKTNLNYNIKKSPYQNLEIIASYDKRYIKKKNGKMIYKNNENKEIKIFNEKFISNNMKRAKMIMNNKQYELKEIVESQKQFVKIGIKFFDNNIYLNSMFKNCNLLFGVENFHNFNTKYLKAICDLFEGCNSLVNIDDISNWNINNINSNLY